MNRNSKQSGLCLSREISVKSNRLQVNDHWWSTIALMTIWRVDESIEFHWFSKARARHRSSWLYRSFHARDSGGFRRFHQRAQQQNLWELKQKADEISGRNEWREKMLIKIRKKERRKCSMAKTVKQLYLVCRFGSDIGAHLVITDLCRRTKCGEISRKWQK